MKRWLCSFSVLALSLGSPAQVADTVVFRQAEVLARNKDCNKALKLLAPYLEQEVPPSRAIVVQARCLIYVKGSVPEGMQLLDAGIQRGQDLCPLLLFRGNLYNEAKMYDRAEADLMLAAENAPDTAMYLEALNQSAWNLLNMRRFDEAHERADRVLVIDPDNYHALNNLALACLEQGDSTLALRTMQRMTELQPDEETGWVNLGYLFAALDRHQEALDAYARAAELGADDAYFLNNRGRSKLGAGDLKGARKDVDRSIKMNGNNSYAYRNLALIHLEENDVAAACTALEKALSLGFTQLYGNEAIELRRKNCQ